MQDIVAVMLSAAMVRLDVFHEIFLADEIAALIALTEEANDWCNTFWFAFETPEGFEELRILFKASPFFREARDWGTFLGEKIGP